MRARCVSLPFQFHSFFFLGLEMYKIKQSTVFSPVAKTTLEIVEGDDGHETLRDAELSLYMLARISVAFGVKAEILMSDVVFTYHPGNMVFCPLLGAECGGLTWQSREV